jgi:hypothetical protein
MSIHYGVVVEGVFELSLLLQTVFERFGGSVKVFMQVVV